MNTLSENTNYKKFKLGEIAKSIRGGKPFSFCKVELISPEERKLLKCNGGTLISLIKARKNELNLQNPQMFCVNDHGQREFKFL